MLLCHGSERTPVRIWKPIALHAFRMSLHQMGLFWASRLTSSKCAIREDSTSPPPHCPSLAPLPPLPLPAWNALGIFLGRPKGKGKSLQGGWSETMPFALLIIAGWEDDGKMAVTFPSLSWIARCSIPWCNLIVHPEDGFPIMWNLTSKIGESVGRSRLKNSHGGTFFPVEEEILKLLKLEQPLRILKECFWPIYILIHSNVKIFIKTLPTSLQVKFLMYVHFQVTFGIIAFSWPRF